MNYRHFFFSLVFFILIISLASSKSSPIQPVSAEEGCFPQYECGNWSECNNDSIQTRVCTDKRCNKKDIVERKFCNIPNCKPAIACSNWSSCNYQRKMSDVLRERLVFEGYQERECVDLGGCAEEWTETRSCSLSFPVEIKKTKWCFQDYVEIFDLNSKRLVGRITESGIDKDLGAKRVDILFLTSDEDAYCDYCFDGVRNYDETGIDCGGNCPECIEKAYFSDWLSLAIATSWLSFAILLIILIWSKSKRYAFFRDSSKKEIAKRSIRERIAGFIRMAKIGTEEERMLEEKIKKIIVESLLFSKKTKEKP